jgi:hypothetical protein
MAGHYLTEHYRSNVWVPPVAFAAADAVAEIV